ncbi:uncharacterized protein LOC110676783 [Aedes aegypti]|uniref:Uncharacterized protein n=1 Tax=Aedes aegypti TaxID=7159 RepID=A0A6I8TF33_AEDAE|nr:uncharacterized protein LOC110676783 [Aedes aegypti]
MACAVKNCNRTKKQSPDVHFFSVPKNLEIRRMWLNRCGIYVENPMPKLLETSKLFVCENHFEPNDYRSINVKSENDSQRKRLWLHADIVPHKNLPSKSHLDRYSFLDIETDPLELSSEFSLDDSNSSSLSKSGENPGCSQHLKRPKLADISLKDNIQPWCKPKLVDRSVATDNLLVSSVSVQCNVVVANKGTQTAHQNMPNRMYPSTPNLYVSSPSSSSVQPSEGSVGSVYLPSTASFHDFRVESSSQEVHCEIQRMVKTKSMNYLGISNDNFFVITALNETTGISERDLLIVLRKIRLNESFEILGDSVGLTGARVGQIFDACVPIVAREMKELIFWPKSNDINKFLPLSFLNKYFSVKSIIRAYSARRVR